MTRKRSRGSNSSTLAEGNVTNAVGKTKVIEAPAARMGIRLLGENTRICPKNYFACGIDIHCCSDSVPTFMDNLTDAERKQNQW